MSSLRATTILDAALWYAEKCIFHVFPVEESKKPLIANWQNDASTDSQRIKEWWTKWPLACIGLACGLSRVLVLDLDTYHTEGKTSGDRIKAALELLSPDFITGRGGEQFLFRCNDTSLRNSVSQLVLHGERLEHVDIRANGGFTILPPSRTQFGEYRRVALGSHFKNLPPVPTVLVDLIRATKSTESQVATSLRDTVTEGTRNVTLTSMAGSMRRRGMGEESILAGLLAENSTKCVPPLQDDEVRLIASSICRYSPLVQPATIGNGEYELECIDSKPFPELRDDALYGFAGEVVKAVDPHTEASKAAVLFQLLTVFGALVGQNAYFEITGDRHPPRLFTLVVGDTSSGAKGTSWGVIRALCGRADIPGFAEMFLDGVASGEGLIKKLEGDGKTALLFESEFARLLTSQKWDGSTLSSRLRSAWDGNDLSHDTVKGTVLKATNPHAVIIGHVTPDELKTKLGPDLIANGYGNRFLYCCSRRSKEIFDTDAAAVPDVVMTDLATKFKECVLRARKIHGRARWFSTEASDSFKAVCRALPRVDGALAKLTQRDRPYILRLASTFALIDGTLDVTKAHIEAAVAVWDYSYRSALWLFGSGGISGTDIAIQFLRERLADGPVLVSELNTLAKAEFIPARGLRTARERLGVRTFKADGSYFWELRRKAGYASVRAIRESLPYTRKQ